MEYTATNSRPPRYSNQARRPDYGQATARSDEHWRRRSTLRIRARNLPPGVSTNEIYKNFEQYGRVVYILILETGQGGRSSVAEINFEPVPAYDFWSRGPVTFRRFGKHADHEQTVSVSVGLDRYQKQEGGVQSPVKEKVFYPERIELPGTRLDFGFLAEPNTMMIMHTCAVDKLGSKLLLNLKRKELEVHFTFIHEGTSRSKPRSFRFPIALDEDFNLWQTASDSFVIQLPKPPPYTKMLAESKDDSHSRDGHSWSLEDMWARQADICAKTITYRQLESMPITLQKQHNTINIARWTTFRFHSSSELQSSEALKMILSALKDWNVQVQDKTDFRIDVAPPNLEDKCWNLINGSLDAKGTSISLYDLSRIDLDFTVRYQFEVCLSNGWISEYSITTEFLQRLSEWTPRKAKQALVYVATNAKRLYDPMLLFTDIQYSKPLRAKRLPDNCVEVYAATVTATGIQFHTPSVEISNRIIRKYKSQAHRFLRVRFEDDDYRGRTRLFPSLNNKMVTIFKRVKRTLKNGIILGNIKYEFLAWGNSQLREHGVWFVAPTSDLTADRIRDEMGRFKETVVAKKAARMGQCFSTTQPVHLPKISSVSAGTVIEDIKRGKYIFSDGVGKISQLAARLVTDQLEIRGSVPSLFQFRLGGCKGVLAVANDIPGVNIQIRDSQFKFDSLSGELEIIRWAQFWQPFLNRQIILCLSHLGVPTTTFMRMQDEAVHALNKAMIDETAALKALRTNVDPNQMTLSLCELVEAGFLATKEPFTLALLNLWRAWSLKYLKEKAKIPVARGAFVLGTVDETATLQGHTKECPTGERSEVEKDPAHLAKLPEVFVQITDVSTGSTKVIEGVCILARNPSLHPGDIRVVMARNVPALSHMVDVVVMPQTGERDLPSMCSGGDLDGDDYIVIWDPDLIPQIWNVEPFHYDPPPPRTVANEITASHLIDFFHDYLRYDALGRIAIAHLAAADRLPDGLDSSVCHELASLHSQAVDYPKTGVPAVMARRLEQDQWPHFMEKTTKRMYRSHKVLGKLYDSVQKVQFKPSYDANFDDRILNSYDPPADLIERLRVVKVDYDNSLRRILTQHGIGTEFELWSTFVLHHSKASKDYKFHEEVGAMSKVLKDQFFEALAEIAGGKDFEHLGPVAVAAYKLTKMELSSAQVKAATENAAIENESTIPFISFPWVLQDTLIKIAVQTVRSRTDDTANTDVSVVDDSSVERPETTIVTYSSKSDSELLAKEDDKAIGGQSDTATPSNGGLPELRIQVEDNSDLYNTGTESSSTEDSAVTTPVADREASSQYIIRDLAQPEDMTNLLPDSIHEQYIASLIDVDDHDKNEAHNDSIHDVQAPPLALASTSSLCEAQDETSPLVDATSEYRDDATIAAQQTHAQWTHFLDSRDDAPQREQIRASEKSKTCRMWRQGRCQNSEETCRFAHHETGGPSVWLQTCWYWKNDINCTRGSDCNFAHWDTGKVAILPTHQSRVDSRRKDRGSSSKRPRRQPMALIKPSTDSDSDLDPVPQARRFTKRSPTKRTTQLESDDEDYDRTEDGDLGTRVLPVKKSAMLDVERATPEPSIDSPTSPDLLGLIPPKGESKALEQFGSESQPSLLDLPIRLAPADQIAPQQKMKNERTLSSISGDHSVGSASGEIHASPESKPSHIPVISSQFETVPPDAATSNILLSNTNLPQMTASANKIPPWATTAKSGHIITHNSGTVQSSRLVLDDPADHGNDSDGYEVDEIFD